MRATSESDGDISTEPGAVLLVDDEPQVLRSLARNLSGCEFTVETFGSAEQAVQRVARGHVQVIVSDISMPGMSGLELLRAVRQYDPDLPVVLVTGLPAVESAAQAVEYGAFKYLMKPVERDALRSTVSRAARLYRLAKTKRQALALLGMSGGASDRAGLEGSFERALNGMWIAFQPIVSAASRSVYGYEAFLRSDEPSLPNPHQVLDAAQRLGELPRLGRAVRERAARASDRAPALFVNLHPQDLMDPDLFDESSPLSRMADRVVLEITERASVGSIEEMRTKLALLRERGFRIAVDDLGAGYAGLNSFALLEPEIVKLDISLVRDIDTSPVKQKLILSMTALCEDMGLSIVAEGVETASERDTLVELGCDLLQGYLFAKPGRAFPEMTW
ncbi:MAG TPA: EAL domain-containing response regulator [Polyangiaceae bacterium]